MDGVEYPDNPTRPPDFHSANKRFNESDRSHENPKRKRVQ